VTLYAEGIERHSTAGHGGFKLSAERNRKVHPVLRAKGGWYEEDAEWAIVAITFPHLFTAFERRCAERTIKDSWPDAWEMIVGTVLAPGESYEKDRRSFALTHADDLSSRRSPQVAAKASWSALQRPAAGAELEQRSGASSFHPPNMRLDALAS